MILILRQEYGTTLRSGREPASRICFDHPSGEERFSDRCGLPEIQLVRGEHGRLDRSALLNVFLIFCWLYS